MVAKTVMKEKLAFAEYSQIYPNPLRESVGRDYWGQPHLEQGTHLNNTCIILSSLIISLLLSLIHPHWQQGFLRAKFSPCIIFFLDREQQRERKERSVLVLGREKEHHFPFDWHCLRFLIWLQLQKRVPSNQLYTSSGLHV